MHSNPGLLSDGEELLLSDCFEKLPYPHFLLVSCVFSLVSYPGMVTGPLTCPLASSSSQSPPLHAPLRKERVDYCEEEGLAFVVLLLPPIVFHGPLAASS